MYVRQNCGKVRERTPRQFVDLLTLSFALFSCFAQPDVARAAMASASPPRSRRRKSLPSALPRSIRQSLSAAHPTAPFKPLSSSIASRGKSLASSASRIRSDFNKRSQLRPSLSQTIASFRFRELFDSDPQCCPCPLIPYK